MEQLQLLLTMVLVPYIGKYLGRQFAYWSKIPFRLFHCRVSSITDYRAGWARYMEWVHNIEIRWTSKKTFRAAGAVETAATL